MGCEANYRQPSTRLRALERTVSQQLRILFIADDIYPGFGGQARASEGHIAALQRRGHELRVIGGNEPQPSEPPPGVVVERLPAWRLGTAQTRFAHPLFSRIAPHVSWADVIHANTPTAANAAATLLAKRQGVPVVMGVHTQLETSTLQAPLIGPPLAWLLATWYRILFSGADLLTAPTRFAAELARQFYTGRIEVVSNGLDLKRGLTVERREASDGSRLLTYVGRLSPEKRPLDLLDLLKELPDEVRLAIAGGGPLDRELRDGIERLGLVERVDLLGYVSEEQKRELLAGPDLFVMPSPAELQSIATLEAMAAGTAVAAVGYDSSAVPQLVSEARGGIVLPPRDPVAQARAVMALLDDDAALRLAKANAAAYAAGHDVASSAEILERLYLELLAPKREATARHA